MSYSKVPMGLRLRIAPIWAKRVATEDQESYGWGRPETSVLGQYSFQFPISWTNSVIAAAVLVRAYCAT